MSTVTTIVLEQEVLTTDIPELAEKFEDSAALEECMQLIEDELERIRVFPNRQGKECEYEPLKSTGYRKVKLYSSKAWQNEKGIKPDLRIIYKYHPDQDTVRVESIGFRVKERPRPSHDPYSKAESRVLQRESY